MRIRVEGLGFSIILGIRVFGSRRGFQGQGFRVCGFGVWRSGFRIQSKGCRVQGSGLTGVGFRAYGCKVRGLRV